MDLSILIPARNEQFLVRTIEDILQHIEANTEIIIGLDGQWSDPGIPQHPRVNVFYVPEAIGQRAMQNRLAKISKAKYLMKVDAHCSFDQGFDRKMLEAFKETGDNVTMVPLMRNLHAFDWVCQSCGYRMYQGPTPDKCPKCGGEMKKDVVWKAKPSPQSTAYRFDRTLHFQYWGEYKKQQKGDLVESMSLQGSCFMATRENYWRLNLCDESWGSWGQQGTEVATKTWLSGGRVIVNKRTWYAHMFRTQGGDFGFPYPQSGRQVERARQISRDTFYNNKYPQAIHSFNWLIKKFNPPGFKKGIIFYTDNQLNLKIAHRVQNQLRKIGIPIVSASLKPMPHFGKNIVVKGKRGYLTMFKQILAALEASDADIIYFCEHDILYHPSHFDFIPVRDDTFYYNINVWKWKYPEKFFLKVNVCRQVSGIVVARETAIKHYRERVAYVEKHGYNRNMGFEPGTHTRMKWQNQFRAENFESKYPIIDIRHNHNLTRNRWSKDQFRNKKNTEGWTISKEVPGWKL